MKKLLVLFTVFGMSLNANGPTPEEIEKVETALQAAGAGVGVLGLVNGIRTLLDKGSQSLYKDLVSTYEAYLRQNKSDISGINRWVRTTHFKYREISRQFTIPIVCMGAGVAIIKATLLAQEERRIKRDLESFLNSNFPKRS